MSASAHTVCVEILVLISKHHLNAALQSIQSLYVIYLKYLYVLRCSKCCTQSNSTHDCKHLSLFYVTTLVNCVYVLINSAPVAMELSV